MNGRYHVRKLFELWNENMDNSFMPVILWFVMSVCAAGWLMISMAHQ